MPYVVSLMFLVILVVVVIAIRYILKATAFTPDYLMRRQMSKLLATGPPIVRAIGNCDLAAVTDLLHEGEDPNLRVNFCSNGTTVVSEPGVPESGGSLTLLGIAAQCGCSEIVSALIEAGANVELEDGYGATPVIKGLMSASVMRILIDSGANVNKVCDYGDTPLIAASSSGSREVISMLIDAGADLNCQTEDGDTALITAAWVGNAEVVDELVKRGADTTLRNKDGKTAMQIAKEERKHPVVKILSQYEAR